jgi:hypothetical protein
MCPTRQVKTCTTDKFPLTKYFKTDLSFAKRARNLPNASCDTDKLLYKIPHHGAISHQIHDIIHQLLLEKHP